MATAAEPIWEQWTRHTFLPLQLLTLADWYNLLAHRPYAVPVVAGQAQVTPIFGSVANSGNIADWMVMKLSDEEGIAIAEYQDGTNGFYCLSLRDGLPPTTPLGSIGANFQLVTGSTATGTPADGSVTTAKLADSAITSVKIADGTIQTVDIAPGAITDPLITGPISYAKISGGPTTLPPSGTASGDLTGAYPGPTVAPLAITEPKLAATSVSTRTLQPLAVTTPILADKNVTTAKLADGCVTNQQLGPSCVTTFNIADGGVQTIDIADRAVTEQKLALNSVGTPELITAAVTTSKIANLQITDALVNDVAWSKITGAPSTYPPTGAAGGDLAGSTYPNPTIAPNAVVTAKIADAQVTDAKIVSLSWGKITGAPSGISPVGPATGDLTGTYPGPTIAPLAVTTGKIALQAVGTNQLADANVTDAKIVSLAYAKLTGAPASLPPSGAAGGSLAGSTYPNPTIAAGAVMRAMLGSDVAPAVPPVPGVPNANMVVSVNATGSALVYTAQPPATLTPGQVTTLYLADGNVTRVKCAADCWLSPIPTGADVGKVLAVASGPTLAWQTQTQPPPAVTVGASPPASPTQGQMWWRSDPDGNLYLYYNDGTSSQWVPAMSSVGTISGPAGGDLSGTYPNPTVLPAAKSKWTDTGATITPTDATKQVVIPSTAAGDTVRFGSRTAKGHLVANKGADAAGLSMNMYLNAAETAWVQDSAAQPSWLLSLIGGGTDHFEIARMPPGGSYGTLLTLDNAGNLTQTGGMITMGATIGRGTINCFSGGSSGIIDVCANLGQVVTAASVWLTRLNSQGDVMQVFRTAPNAGAQTMVFQLDSNFNMVLTGPIAQKASGTTWANPSDRRLKDSITDYTTGLAAIVALQPRTFLYNGKGGSQAGLRGYGYIADEVELVMPEMLSITKAKLNPDDAEDTDIQTLDTSNVTLALVNAVQELATRVMALEAR